MNRDFVKSTSEKFLIGFFSFFVFVSCDSGGVKQSGTLSYEVASSKDSEDFLLGSWEAQWSTSAESFKIDESSTNFTMKGKIDFKKNGKVKIQAYGYDGCIFMSDTMTNELQYQVLGDTVNLRAEDDSFGLPYQILEAQQNMVKLVLMEDIALTLTR